MEVIDAIRDDELGLWLCPICGDIMTTDAGLWSDGDGDLYHVWRCEHDFVEHRVYVQEPD